MVTFVIIINLDFNTCKDFAISVQILCMLNLLRNLENSAV